jgi:hypothetical protein
MNTQEREFIKKRDTWKSILSRDASKSTALDWAFESAFVAWLQLPTEIRERHPAPVSR